MKRIIFTLILVLTAQADPQKLTRKQLTKNQLIYEILALQKNAAFSKITIKCLNGGPFSISVIYVYRGVQPREKSVKRLLRRAGSSGFSVRRYRYTDRILSVQITEVAVDMRGWK